MKRGKFLLIMTASLIAVAAVMAFSGYTAKKAQAAFSNPMSYIPGLEKVDAPELGVIEFKGVVESVQADTYTVSGIDFRYDTLTDTSGTPAVGDSVKVKAMLLPDLTRYALKIEKMDSMVSASKFEFYGIVEAMDASQWTVSGEQVSVDMAMIDSGIAVGSLVEVEGYIEAGMMVAEKIQLKGDISAPGGTKIEFFGTIDSITGSVLVISGKTVNTDATTEIKGMLAVGDLVKVEGLLNADGTYLAHEIKLAVDPSKESEDDKDDDDDEEFKFTGQVESISDTLWVIGGMSFIIDTSTKIEGSPVVGDVVKIEAFVQNDGTYLAHEIELEDHDDDVDDDRDDDQDDDQYDD
ncbi:MAG: DUF5666 domain-containing protein, partial [Bellilinea sp.]